MECSLFLSKYSNFSAYRGLMKTIDCRQYCRAYRIHSTLDELTTSTTSVTLS